MIIKVVSQYNKYRVRVVFSYECTVTTVDNSNYICTKRIRLYRIINFIQNNPNKPCYCDRRGTTAKSRLGKNEQITGFSPFSDGETLNLLCFGCFDAVEVYEWFVMSMFYFRKRRYCPCLFLFRVTKFASDTADRLI